MSEARDLVEMFVGSFIQDRCIGEAEKAATEAEGAIILGALELGEAWAEAEAALPEGWALEVLSVAATTMPVRLYYATTREYEDASSVEGTGSTPAAALRALAAKLREAKG